MEDARINRWIFVCHSLLSILPFCLSSSIPLFRYYSSFPIFSSAIHLFYPYVLFFLSSSIPHLQSINWDAGGFWELESRTALGNSLKKRGGPNIFSVLRLPPAYVRFRRKNRGSGGIEQVGRIHESMQGTEEKRKNGGSLEAESYSIRSYISPFFLSSSSLPLYYSSIIPLCSILPLYLYK